MLEVNRPYIKTIIHDALEQQMNDVIKQQRLIPYTRVIKTPRLPRCLTAIVTGLLLSVLPLLTGCGGGGETGNDPSVTPSADTVSLVWQPVPDHSVVGYFVHYGRQSPGHSGSCAYEQAMFSTDSAATITNLDPDTHYYFSVSAYNGLQSACSEEISTIISSPVGDDGADEGREGSSEGEQKQPKANRKAHQRHAASPQSWGLADRAWQG